MTTLAAFHPMWVTSRAAGTAALVLASLSVLLGVTMSMRVKLLPAADRRVVHEAMSLATIAAIAVHAGATFLDPWLSPGLAGTLVPFGASYARGWTAVGQVAGWGTVLLGLSFYARRLIGVARWRRLHGFAALTWFLALIHAFGEGTDAGSLWWVLLVAAAAVPALAAVGVRLVTDRSPQAART
jgi:sulfoxide reductase heme-binding subunit YedZ